MKARRSLLTTLYFSTLFGPMLAMALSEADQATLTRGVDRIAAEQQSALGPSLKFQESFGALEARMEALRTNLADQATVNSAEGAVISYQDSIWKDKTRPQLVKYCCEVRNRYKEAEYQEIRRRAKQARKAKMTPAELEERRRLKREFRKKLYERDMQLMNDGK